MSSLDVLVMASIRTDGIPQAGLQAMATGLPLVGTDVGGIPEIVRGGETGLLVPPGAAPALADAVGRLIADKALRNRFGATGLERVRERYSLEGMLDALERLYEDRLRRAQGNGR